MQMSLLSKLQLKEEFEDTKGVIRIRISKKNRQTQWPKDTKGVIRIRLSKKNRQTQWPKGKVRKDKQRPTKHSYKTKDRLTRTPSDTRRVYLVTNPVISHEWGKDRDVLSTIHRFFLAKILICWYFFFSILISIQTIYVSNQWEPALQRWKYGISVRQCQHLDWSHAI
jgi:hypothetical protein